MPMHWGDLGDRGCTALGLHEYSAVLWDIPWGQSWENACAGMPGASGTTVAGRIPDRCVNAGGRMWGEWVVADSNCSGHWGGIGDRGCTAFGTHTYSAILWDIPPGQRWEDACASTPAAVGTPVAGRLPDRCIGAGGNMWGEWDTPDATCHGHWGSVSRTCDCPTVGVARYSSVLWDIPPGQDWTQACNSTPGPEGTDVAGQLPQRCVGAGGQMWGEWRTTDLGCCCDVCHAAGGVRDVCDEYDEHGIICVRSHTEAYYDSCAYTTRDCP